MTINLYILKKSKFAVLFCRAAELFYFIFIYLFLFYIVIFTAISIYTPKKYGQIVQPYKQAWKTWKSHLKLQ